MWSELPYRQRSRDDLERINRWGREAMGAKVCNCHLIRPHVSVSTRSGSIGYVIGDMKVASLLIATLYEH